VINCISNLNAKGIDIDIIDGVVKEDLVNGGLIKVDYLVVCLSNLWLDFEFGLVLFVWYVDFSL